MRLQDYCRRQTSQVIILIKDKLRLKGINLDENLTFFESGGVEINTDDP